MKYLVLLLALVLAPLPAPQSTTADTAWRRQAQNVTIVRDDWGIAHVTGKSDADAVFGMVYAQGEDDFNRVETNFINSQGRLAEAEGESAIYRDLRMKLLINPHTSFFFRSELQMTSDEGLNAYGAATWGQFFLYQGFNNRVGWMHTTSGVDAMDEYLETVEKKDRRW